MARYPELEGKSVTITGAGRAIGLAIAQRFVEEGSRVMLTDIAEGNAGQVIALAQERGTKAVYRNVDVTSKDQVEAMVAKAVECFGQLNVMVCNAGIAEIAPLVEASEDSYDRQMAVNAKGTFLCATAAARQMLKQGGGQIIINASSPEKYTFLKARVIPDRVPGQGPLMGISAVLKAAQNEKVFIVACDIPDINLDFVRRLLAEASHNDCVIPISGQDELEPLFAVYRKSVLPVVDDLLESGKRQIRLLYPRVKTKYLAMGKADWYRNLNTITDFKNYQRSPAGSTR